MAQKARKFKDAAPPQRTPVEHNEKFKVLSYECRDEEGGSGKSRYAIYLLNPGEWFENFGGSKHGLQVTKTASMVARQNFSGIQRDTEYNLADKDAWRYVHIGLTYNLVAAAKAARVVIDKLTAATPDALLDPEFEAEFEAEVKKTLARLSDAINEVPPGDRF